MRTLTAQLTSQTAADLMSRDVFVIPKHMSLRTAARLLSQTHVSGAPVIDENGVCVGVISATDFVRLAGVEQRMEHAQDGQKNCVCVDWQVIEIDSLPTNQVAAYMSANLVAVPSSATIQEIARAMVKAHVHRIIVIDELRRPIGVISTIDIVAALANSDM